MKAISTTIQGLEDITIKEIKEILKVKAKIVSPSKVKFTTEEIDKFNNLTRSSLNTYQLIDKLKFKNIEDIENKIKKINIDIKDSFVVRCHRVGNHKFNSLDIERRIGEIIYKKYKKRVEFENPETIVYIDILNNYCFIGLNPSTFKRNYKLRTNFLTLNSSLAYSLVRTVDYKINEALLIPFCSSGEIAIESCLYILKTQLNEKPKTKEKLKIITVGENIKNSVINSKIAGVYNLIRIKRLEMDWLDTEFKKNSIDKIIMYIPKKDDYSELFRQIRHILKKNGRICTLSTNKIKAEGFKTIKKIEIMHGIKQEISILRKL